jgi:hypothetical protein
MPDLTLKCRACGMAFRWTEKEQNAQEPETYEAPEECKSCRVKQDGQRS